MTNPRTFISLSPGDQQTTRITKRTLAENLYPGMTYDTALPLSWTDHVREKLYKPDDEFGNVAGHFVWGYAPDSPWGAPWPLTLEGIMILSRLSF